MAHRKKWRLPLPSTVVINAVMVFVLVVVLIPMLNLVAKSFSDPAQVAGMSGWRIIPAGFSLINYQIIFSNPAIWRALFNSLFITVIGVALNVVVTSMAAYALTRPNLPGKKLFMAFFIMMMIFEPGIIQEYFVVKGLGLLDNIWAMVLYNSVTVYNLILLMRFFSDTPQAILEAAAIDGAGHIATLFKVFHRRQHELFESRNHRRGHSADPLHVPLHPEALYQRGHAGRSERITPTKTKEERK